MSKGKTSARKIEDKSFDRTPTKLSTYDISPQNYQTEDMSRGPYTYAVRGQPCLNLSLIGIEPATEVSIDTSSYPLGHYDIQENSRTLTNIILLKQNKKVQPLQLKTNY